MSDPTNPVTLPQDWYIYVVNDGVNVDQPGLYEWAIEGVGTYIGKYKRIRRPTKEYARNVVRLLNNKPYRVGNPNGFRRIHRELNVHTANAVKSGSPS